MDDSTPFDERTGRLLKLALAIGAEADGAVRSNVRKSLAQGVTVSELRAVTLPAITTCGFPTAIAGLGWAGDVLARGSRVAQIGPGWLCTIGGVLVRR